jgi:hypothetical protein
MNAVQDLDQVATYSTADGAARAVEHLVQLNHDPADVAIAPRDFETVDTDRLRDRAVRGARTCAILSALVLFVVTAGRTMGAGRLLSAVVVPTVIGVLVASAIGAVVGMISRRFDASRVGRPRHEVRATTFVVVAGRRAGAARHDLARWWNPAAHPAPRRRAA